MTEILHNFRPLPNEIRMDEIITLQRRFSEFNQYLYSPAKLASKSWQEKSNPSGITLSHYLKMKNQQLQQLHHDISNTVQRFAQYEECDIEKLVEQVSIYDSFLGYCIEDWGIYLQPDNSIFICYIQNYAECVQSELRRKSDVEATIHAIFDRHLQFPWANFQPLDYEQIQQTLIDLCSLTNSELAQYRLLHNRQNGKKHFSRHNKKMRNIDNTKLEQIRIYQDYPQESLTEIDSDYMRDLFRLKALFFVEGDPVPIWYPESL